MSGREPLVSVGLPVYNGERYLREAVESILAQEYRNLELIISDNASKDGTEAICREYAARDPRVRYYRSAKNMGAVHNFNRVFKLAQGEYFMWAAFDDVRHPEYVRRCVEALESNSEAVLCCTDVHLIDEEGRDLDDPRWPRGIRPAGRTPRERIRELARATFWYDFYGLMRSSVLRNTRLAQPVWGFDVVVLMEMCLRGPVVVVPEPLFSYRVFTRKVQQDLADTLAPDKKAIPVSSTDLSVEMVRSILRSRLHPLSRVGSVAEFVLEFCYRNPTVRPGIYADAIPSARRALTDGRYGMALSAMTIRAMVTVFSKTERFMRSIRRYTTKVGPRRS